MKYVANPVEVDAFRITAARDRWIAGRQKELLPTRYVHVVFTLPAPLERLAFLCFSLFYSVFLSLAPDLQKA